jgi:dihydrofolate reductase
MAKLIYGGMTSLDGYINDEEGKFDWGEPDDEVHSYVNDLERPIGTYLYGRRLYEVMRYWQDPGDLDAAAEHHRDYARIWQAADKVVYSSSLESVSTPRTRLEREFDPAAVGELKDAAEADLGMGGPTLATEALRAGLVDELYQFVYPIIVGGGTPWLPHGLHLDLELLDERRFSTGVVYLHYRARS